MTKLSEKEVLKVCGCAALNYGHCPSCGSYTLKVIRTIRPIREIKCTSCDESFETIEIFTLLHNDCALESAGAANLASGVCSLAG